MLVVYETQSGRFICCVHTQTRIEVRGKEIWFKDKCISRNTDVVSCGYFEDVPIERTKYFDENIQDWMPVPMTIRELGLIPIAPPESLDEAVYRILIDRKL